MDSASLDQKLGSTVSEIIDKHRSSLLPHLLGSASGPAASLTAGLLRNDEAVRKVAEVCYELLPGLVRFAVKQPVFVGFVMNNREKILGKLVQRASARPAA